MDYILSLQHAIKHLYGCNSVYLETVAIKETFNDDVIWNGYVEVFEMISFAKADKCYAWSHADDPNDLSRRLVVTLHIDPINSPRRAVQAVIAGHTKDH